MERIDRKVGTVENGSLIPIKSYHGKYKIKVEKKAS